MTWMAGNGSAQGRGTPHAPCRTAATIGLTFARAENRNTNHASFQHLSSKLKKCLSKWKLHLGNQMLPEPTRSATTCCPNERILERYLKFSQPQCWTHQLLLHAKNRLLNVPFIHRVSSRHSQAAVKCWRRKASLR
jgi:hypothetical protein